MWMTDLDSVRDKDLEWTRDWSTFDSWTRRTIYADS